MKTGATMAESLAKLDQMAAFNKKYHRLIHHLLSLRRESAIRGIVIKEVSLMQFWHDDYPDLEMDMIEQGLVDQFLGLKILLHP